MEGDKRAYSGNVIVEISELVKLEAQREVMPLSITADFSEFLTIICC